MAGLPVEKSKRYTWADYQHFPDNKRWEIIGGEPFDMSAAPATRHQRILLELSRQIGNALESNPCEPFIAPTDVKLSEDDVVQPDLFVVCEKEKIKSSHIDGAPTLIIEVLSPSTTIHDRKRKRALYARSGVQEVWLVTPYPWLIEVYLLDGETYRLVSSFSKKDTLKSPTFPSLKLDLKKVFDFPLEPEERINLIKEGRPEYVTKAD